MFYKKKPVTVEAITFDEFVQYGIEHGGNVVNGMPWHFEYNGHAVTHTTDEADNDCYIIPTLEGNHLFTRNDMLITGVKGEIYPCKRDIFQKTYEAAGKTVIADLCDTVSMMQSPDYKERFRAEYFQLCIRISKLKAMLEKWERDELEFVPFNPYELLKAQLAAMKTYQLILKIRAGNEDVDLSMTSA